MRTSIGLAFGGLFLVEGLRVEDDLEALIVLVGLDALFHAQDAKQFDVDGGLLLGFANGRLKVVFGGVNETAGHPPALVAVFEDGEVLPLGVPDDAKRYPQEGKKLVIHN